MKKTKTMTKAELIKAIQITEARAWQTLQADKKTFGEDHKVTELSRSQWSPVYELRESLGIAAMSVRDMIAEGVLPQ
jgi:hypothetical protein